MRRSPVKLYREKRPNGVESPYWYCDFRTPGGRRVRKSTRCAEYGAARRVALAWHRHAQDVHADAEAGVERPADVALLALADDFIDARRADGRAPRYIDALVAHLRAYILPHFGAETLVATVTRAQVLAFRRDLLSGALQSGAMQSRRGDAPAPATVNRIITTLRQLLKYGCQHGHLRENPARNVAKVKERTDERHRALTDREIAALLEQLDAIPGRRRDGKPPPRHGLWARFLLATGLRDDEAAQLTWQAIDIARRLLRVQATTTKSARNRRVPLPTEALDVLAELGDVSTDIGPVFGSYNRRKTLRRAWERTGLPGRAPSAHDFRHTYASRAVEAGLTIEELRVVLGHDSIVTTQRFVHAYGAFYERLAAKLTGVPA